MKLYILRHGAAEPSGPDGDSSRRLTEDGKEICRRMAAALQGKVAVDTLLSSPLIRARQTGELFSAGLGLHLPLEITGVLTPGSDPRETILELSSRGRENIMIVGHNPHLSDLTAALVSNGSLRFDMKKTSVLCIDFSGSVREGSGELRWIAVPKLMM